MLLVIDNFDSFTYNLVQYFGKLGVEMEVYRNNAITVAEAVAKNPSRVLISPGPCAPDQAGVSSDIIRAFAGKVPIFGVCLGHQCVGQIYGGKIIRAKNLMHGKTSPVRHNGKDLFQDMSNPFDGTRYHSLVIERSSCPDCLEITAESDDGEIMGIKHRQLPIWGVQFHPESLATTEGMALLENFLKIEVAD
jgi:anthranilate synthase/aminodeoxychorismate synthase-like glutamine amidotransferase